MITLPPVDETLAIATMDITREIMPEGYNLCDPGPDSLEACTEYFLKNGKVGVDPAFNGRTSIFHANEPHYAFQAWHDWCHVKGQCSFDIPGERRVHDIMVAHLTRWWVNSEKPVTRAAFERSQQVLRMFNLGRLEHWLAYGEPPSNPREFLYGYLTAGGVIVPPPRCEDAPLLSRNEWTHYVK